MLEKRWLLRVGPPLLTVGILSMLASSSTGAAAQPWEPGPCVAGVDAFQQSVTAHAPTRIRDAAKQPWYRVDPQLVNGELAGQRVHLGRDGRWTRFMDLSPESFATGPFGRVVLVGTDDGQSSNVRAIDVYAACSWSLADDRAVVRRATLGPDGRTVYLFRVDRTTRADLGVWRRDVATGQFSRVLGPLPGDARIGPTFTTELSWSVDPDRLVVQSCGADRCRTRLLDPVTLDAATLGGPDQGELIGVASGHVVFRASACGGLPCAIHDVDVTTGARRIAAQDAGLARLDNTPRGPRLVHEIALGGQRALRVVSLGGVEERRVSLGGGVRLVPPPAVSNSAAPTPPGWVLVAPEGRIGVDAGLETYVALDDGSIVSRLEMLR